MRVKTLKYSEVAGMRAWSIGYIWYKKVMQIAYVSGTMRVALITSKERSLVARVFLIITRSDIMH